MPNVYSYYIRSRYGKGWGRGIAPHPSHCYTCGAQLPERPQTGGSGYGCSDEEPAPALSTPMRDASIKLRKDEVITRSRAHCYDCCAQRERDSMIETGRATLYLSERDKAWEITDWPGRLRFPARRGHSSRNNFGARRVDVWFTGPDNKPWHGVNLGDNQILRCRRIKK